MTALLSAVRDHVPHATEGELERFAVARDLWPRDTLTLVRGSLPGLPDVVCWPRTEAELLSLLSWAGREGVPLVPYGGGSGVCGGAAGHPGTVVVDCKAMQHLGPVDPDRACVEVEPGLVGQVFEDRLHELGWTTRHSPSSIWCSTVGGWAAARSAGQFSSGYGKFEDMVLAMRVATPAGLVQTGWDAPSETEDLGPLVMGSEGTLGVITRLTVRVLPRPAHRWMRSCAFPDVHTALEAMRALMQADLQPAVLRLYDPVDTLVGGRLGESGGGGSRTTRHLAALARSGWKALDARERFRQRELALPLSLPRALNAAAHSLGNRVMLIVGWEGPPALVRERVAAARPLLAAGEDRGAEAGEAWYAHRHDVSYKMSPIFGRGGFADTMEVAATWSQLETLYAAVRNALARHVVVMAHFSHAYPEGCSIYFSFAGKADPERYDRAWTAALDAVHRAGGTVTHHHGVGALKARATTREVGHARRVYQRRKDRLDPGGVLNPGRLYADTAAPLPDFEPPAAAGPVLALDPGSLLARVDPLVEPGPLGAALRQRGFQPRVPPEAPLADWLRRWRPGVGTRHAVPFFGVQARFSDGRAARLGLAPRSAAGPDLRWGLLWDARAEWVEIPVVRARSADSPRSPASGAAPLTGTDEGEE